MNHRRSIGLFSLLSCTAALLASGCAAQRAYFRPTDNLVEVPGRGYLAVASYDLEDESGQRVGTLRVNSQGVFEAELDSSDGKQRVLQVEVSLTNTGTAPLLLPKDEQTIVNLDGIPRLLPYRIFVDGNPALELQVPPDEARNVDLFYKVGSNVDLSRLEDFLFHWRVRAGAKEQVEFTHFIRMPETSYYYPRYCYAGYWNGYFFPGYYTIPPWGLGILFAPPLVPYYEDATGVGGAGAPPE